MSIADTFPDGLRVKQVTAGVMIQQRRRLLLADQPGAGKTAEALLALELDGLFDRESTILITTTQTACQLTWAQELEQRVATQHRVLICDLTKPATNSRTGQPKKGLPSMAVRDAQLKLAVAEQKRQHLPLIILVNFEALRWRYFEPPKLTTLWDCVFDAIVIDESHLVLPTEADGKRDLSQFLYGLQQLNTSPNAIRLAMSGTPDRGKLNNRYGTYRFLNPNGFRSYWAWVRSHFTVTPAHWGGVEIGKLRDPEAWAHYEQQVMLRRTKQEMFDGLPEKQWAGNGGIDLPMTVPQQLAYDAYTHQLEELEEMLLMEAGDEQTPSEKRAGNKARSLKLMFALRSRQMAICTWDFIESEDAAGNVSTTGVPLVLGPSHSNKLAWILEFLEDRGHTVHNWDPSLGKVVIVSFFTKALGWLQQELADAGIASAILSGDTSREDKIKIEERFQRGDLRIVLLSGHMGVSINLDAADDMIFLDCVHDPDRLEQCEDRIHRASRMHQVVYHRLVSKGTADHVVLGAADTRYRETRRMYDGSRGVKFARRMLGLL